MGFKSKNVLVLAKVESVYGTDSVPLATTDAILATTAEVDVLAGEEVERELLTGKPGNNAKLLTGTHSSLSLGVELQGSGALGTAPKYGALLKACAMAEVVTASTKVEYSSVNTAEQSATLHAYMDANLHKMPGGRGSVKFSAAIGSVPKMDFSFKGMYVTPIAQAVPAATLTGFLAPKAMAHNNTTFSIDSFAAKLESFELDLANEIVVHELVGAFSIEVTNRKPAGSFVFEAPPLGTKDFFTLAANETLIPFQLTIGTVAGRIVEWQSAQIQIGRPTYTDKNGVLMLTVPYTVMDDFIFRVR